MTPRIEPILLLCLFGVVAGLAQTQPVESLQADSFGPSERWSHYLHRTFGPLRLGVLAAETALDHARQEPACWDASAGSYAQRYARAFDRRLIRNSTELAAGLLTGEDLRYKQSQSHSMQGRLWHALLSSVTAQMPDGTRRPAYTRFLAAAGTDLATAHWTGQPIRVEWASRSLGWSLLDQMQTNVLDEFEPEIRRVAGRLWKAPRRGN